MAPLNFEQKKVLRYVRWFGRASCAETAKATRIDRLQTYRVLYELRRRDLVLHAGFGIYVATAAGVKMVAKIEAEVTDPLFQDIKE